MSQFDRYTEAKFVEGLRIFLGLKKSGFLRDFALLDKDAIVKKGRGLTYKKAGVEALLVLANEKSKLAESISTSIGERIGFALDYLPQSNASLGLSLGVSGELVRLWKANVHKPKDMLEVSLALKVPLRWLETGQQDSLPANSHIGVRFEGEALKNRLELHEISLIEMNKIASTTDLISVQVHMEHAVSSNLHMSKLSRRAGGRWQHNGKALFFAPWVPIREDVLVRRYWSDEVESIIVAELSNNKMVSVAWDAIQKRCETLGMTPDMYPKKIALYKRLAKERNLQEKFGVNFNIKACTSMH